MGPAINAFVMVSCATALIAAATVRAEQLSDPTRPPGAAEVSPSAAQGEQAATGLQAIIRRHGRRPAAVINGQYVELGGRSGDARVVNIGEDSVTLQGAAGRETLRLAPDVQKKPADAQTRSTRNRENMPSKGPRDDN